MDLMLISSSYVVDDKAFMGYCQQELQQFLPDKARILFVPFAYSKHDEYTNLVRDGLSGLGVSVTGAHVSPTDDVDSLQEQYDVVFCGGGNTFLLLRELYERGLLDIIRDAVRSGTFYMGSSAGANVACPTIGTTNDMPIVEPPSLNALNLVPFNINPHFYERPPSFKHKGESRRDRIREFLTHNTVDVLALPEGSFLVVRDDHASVGGKTGGIVFGRKGGPTTITPGESVDFLFDA